MDTEKYINEKLPQDKAQQFAEILSNAITSYINNKDSCSVKEWLKSYLSENIPDKSEEEITQIAHVIVDTITLHEKTMESMESAIESGKSAESWLQEETASNEKSMGKQAREFAETHTALTAISNQYAEYDEQQEVIDIDEIPAEEWNDNNWNKYKIKDLVAETVRQAAETVIRTTASDLYEKTIAYGLKNVITDKKLISESIIKGAGSGIKIAAAGAMEIAESCNILPTDETDTEIRSLIVSMAIENLKTLIKVSKSEIGLAEGLKNIKDTSLAAVATIIKVKSYSVGAEIGTAIGASFGPEAAVAGNFIGGVVGRMAGIKIIDTAKLIGTAAKTVSSKATNTAKSIGNKIKNGLRSFFRS